MFPTMVKRPSFATLDNHDIKNSITPPTSPKNAGSIKIPKSYGTYSKIQQDEVIAFIKEGNSLRTAEKMFGIPKSTMHCWLKKVNNGTDVVSNIAEFSDCNNLVPTEKKDLPSENVSGDMEGHHKSHQQQPVVIEESKLIRFLQTSDGAGLISKAYNIPLNDFNIFTKHAKRTENSESSVRTSTGVHDDSPPVSSDSEFKKMMSTHRNVHLSGKKQPPTLMFNSRKRNINKDFPGHTLHKKLKKEDQLCANTLLSLLQNKQPNSNTPVKKKFVLSAEQLLVASKLINTVNPENVNTYICSKPMEILCSTAITDSKYQSIIDEEQAQLSPTFPKVLNPVSIKAERPDLDCLMKPPSFMLYNQNAMNKLIVNNVTKPTVSSNTNATLNLNEMNRTQSEKELMALVDGENVTADELCTDFNDALEINNWIDNETWYTDQYLQHFQVSPVSSVHSNDVNSIKCEDNNAVSDDEGCGITFVSHKDKEEILAFLANGNDVAAAERYFNVPKSTIESWITTVELENPKKATSKMLNKRKRLITQSAFYKPRKFVARENGPISVFSKLAR